MFNSIHPHEKCHNREGVVTGCFELFQKYFPEYHNDILFFTAKFFTLSRIRLENEKANQSKKKKSRGPSTYRGRKQIARQSL